MKKKKRRRHASSIYVKNQPFLKTPNIFVILQNERKLTIKILRTPLDMTLTIKDSYIK
jgi:hypothetical protein